MRDRANLADEWPPLRTLTDLALRFWNVRLTCRRCRHVRVLHGAAVWWLFQRKRWNDDLMDAARHFHCGPCSENGAGRQAPWIDKTRDEPTGEPLPLPSDYEWKKLIARYRS